MESTPAARRSRRFWRRDLSAALGQIVAGSLLLHSLVANCSSSTVVRGRCWIPCGVITETRSGVSTTTPSPFLSFVSSVWDNLLQAHTFFIGKDRYGQVEGRNTINTFIWDNLRYAKSLTGVDLQFVRIQRRDDMTMDTLITAYMEIGTTNVSAMIGTYRQALATATQKFGIPYFVVEVGSESTAVSVPDATYVPIVRPYNLLSVLPHPSDLYSIVIDVLKALDWPSIAVLYEDGTDGVRLIEDIVRMPHIHVGAWKLGTSRSSGDVTVRDALLQVRHLAMTNIVLMTSRDIADAVLDSALHLSMLSNRYSWLLPTMSHLPNTDHTNSQFDKSDYAAVHDSLLTLYYGVKLHHQASGGTSCQWANEHLMSTLTKIDGIGATGDLQFREDGTRKGYIVGIFGLSSTGLIQVGTWNSSIRDVRRRLQFDYSSLRSRDVITDPRHRDVTPSRLRVVVVLEPPYITPVLAGEATTEQPGPVYRGYLVDLLDVLAKRVSFTYSLHVISDGQRGQTRPDGTWSGLVGELIAGVFDTVHLSAVVCRRSTVDRFIDGPFLFIRPLTGSVWLLIGVVLLTTTVLLYTVDRLGSRVVDAAGGTSGGIEVAVELRRGNRGVAVGLAQSAWCALTTMILMSRFSPSTMSAAPTSTSGRLAVAALWTFSLVVVVSYTANMAAQLTASQLPVTASRTAATVSVSSDVAHLLRRTGSDVTRFLTLARGDVSALFPNGAAKIFDAASDDDRQRSLTNNNNHFRWTFVSSIEDGIRSVAERSDSIFVYDSRVVDHEMRVNLAELVDKVEVFPVWSSTDGVGLAFGVTKGFAHTTALNLALSRLAYDGTLGRLKHRWLSGDAAMTSADGGGAVAAAAGGGGLSLYELGGLFLLLAVVVIVLLLVSVAEHCVRRRGASHNHIARKHSTRDENHTAQKQTPTGSSSACNSGAPYDILQIEPFSDAIVSSSGDETTRRSRNSTLLPHKETNF